ncbi:HPF/RaiA family ribosome-associated protein [Paludisphaera mucosa]|uniref:HPF/RaiA family ribosome-associated protein n=1 Tax=Paludisphaera mucosa TaxID=3030827 RepID=A0ABT6FKG6_9BACT|nr:HPF/RaiA family ribosome-associated protein [Paludisphaera mucosa]
MQIKISSRHGELAPGQRERLEEKAGKLTKFGRLMAIEIATSHEKGAWNVEFQVSAEHKNDFVATETGPTLEAAADQCLHKIENQLRKYKEKTQHHKGDVPHGGIPLGSVEPTPNGEVE